MPTTKRLQFSTVIGAPVDKVWSIMLAPESYKEWTSAFAEGSYYEGSWNKGARIKFLTPSGEGMVSEIAENRPQEFISIRHLGYIANGVEDTGSESVRSWAPAFENYTFSAVPEGTRLDIDQDIMAEYEKYMQDAWPKALEKLKLLCEGGRNA